MIFDILWWKRSAYRFGEEGRWILLNKRSIYTAINLHFQGSPKRHVYPELFFWRNMKEQRFNFSAWDQSTLQRHEGMARWRCKGSIAASLGLILVWWSIILTMPPDNWMKLGWKIYFASNIIQLDSVYLRQASATGVDRICIDPGDRPIMPIFLGVWSVFPPRSWNPSNDQQGFSKIKGCLQWENHRLKKNRQSYSTG